jgi:hypothetical protein
VRWYELLTKTGSVGKTYSTGRPRRPGEDVDSVKQAFLRRPKHLISREGAELEMPQTTGRESFSRAYA